MNSGVTFLTIQPNHPPASWFARIFLFLSCEIVIFFAWGVLIGEKLMPSINALFYFLLGVYMAWRHSPALLHLCDRSSWYSSLSSVMLRFIALSSSSFASALNISAMSRHMSLREARLNLPAMAVSAAVERRYALTLFFTAHDASSRPK